MNEGETISKKELYNIARETRNFEISLFWQRSNYFLVLNTAIAVGFFSLNNSLYAFWLGLFGLGVSILWLVTNLGSKFWQSRWEQRLCILEKQLGEGINLFSADWDVLREDVKASFNLTKHSHFRQIFDLLVLKKPSVSFVMILLSVLFIILWSVLVVIVI